MKQLCMVAFALALMHCGGSPAAAGPPEVVCYGPSDPELDAGLCQWPPPDAGARPE
jgi:hypothetical protein